MSPARGQVSLTPHDDWETNACPNRALTARWEGEKKEYSQGSQQTWILACFFLALTVFVSQGISPGLSVLVCQLGKPPCPSVQACERAG